MMSKISTDGGSGSISTFVARVTKTGCISFNPENEEGEIFYVSLPTQEVQTPESPFYGLTPVNKSVEPGSFGDVDAEGRELASEISESVNVVGDSTMGNDKVSGNGLSPKQILQIQSQLPRRTSTTSSGIYEVEQVLKKRKRAGRKAEYFLKWEGYPDSQNTWEPVGNIHKGLISDFELRQKEKNAVKPQEAPETGEGNEVSSGEKNVDGQEQPNVSGVDIGREPEEIPSVDPGQEPEDAEKQQEAPETGERKEVSSEEKNVDGQEQPNVSGVPGREPKEILDVAKDQGNLVMLMRFPGEPDVELVPAKEANAKWPQKVIAFYEKRIAWTGESSTN